jgi:hypothetical protein
MTCACPSPPAILTFLQPTCHHEHLVDASLMPPGMAYWFNELNTVAKAYHAKEDLTTPPPGISLEAKLAGPAIAGAQYSALF